MTFSFINFVFKNKKSELISLVSIIVLYLSIHEAPDGLLTLASHWQLALSANELVLKSNIRSIFLNIFKNPYRYRYI